MLFYLRTIQNLASHRSFELSTSASTNIPLSLKPFSIPLKPLKKRLLKRALLIHFPQHSFQVSIAGDHSQNFLLKLKLKRPFQKLTVNCETGLSSE